MPRERGNRVLRAADRLLGIPAVRLVGSFRRSRILPSAIQSIGLLKTGAIGDTVLASAIIADLRAAFQSASITLFSSRSNYEIATMLSGVDQVIALPLPKLAECVKRIRSIPVDIMIDLGQWPRVDALLSALSRASFTVGFRTPGQYRHYAYDRSVLHSSEIHEVENYRNLLRAIELNVGHRPELPIPAAIFGSESDYAVFHLWAGGVRHELKEWPVDRWARLIEEFTGWGLKVFLTGAPSDRLKNEEVIARVAAHARPAVASVAGRPLAETASILAHSRLLVTVNTGVMHMGAALGTPVVALHGPTSSRRWGPVGTCTRVIDSPLPGCGYLNLGWEYKTRPPRCMECISYTAVRDACLDMLRTGRMPHGLARVRTPQSIAEQASIRAGP